MPVFNGFEGEKFVFKGSPNKFYNLLSDDYLQINAHINNFDNLDQIGLKFGQPASYIQCDAAKNRLTINDRAIYGRCYFPIGLKDFEGYTEPRHKFESTNFNTTVLQAAGDFVNCLFVEAGKYHFYIIRNINRKLLPESPFFYNFIATVRNPNVRPHGLIGQTADFDGKQRLNEMNAIQGEGVIEGKPFDYQVSNLWGDDFKYNKYKAKILKI